MTATARGAADLANIVGMWSYSTSSNCGGGTIGQGQVTVTWHRSTGLYVIGGWVQWPHTGQIIRWSGTARYDPGSREVQNSSSNSLGDQVRSTWRLEGQGPERLVTDWSQTNGCRGHGVASNRVHPIQ